MDNKTEVFLTSLLIAVVISGLFFLIQTLKPTKHTEEPIEPNNDDPSLIEKLDPTKQTLYCVANYLDYREVNREQLGKRDMIERILEKDIDFYELENLALQKGFEVHFSKDNVYLARKDVKGFNQEFQIGFELKKGDVLEQGLVKITVDDTGRVLVQGPVLSIKNKISEEELYSIIIKQELDYYLKQSISAEQWGRRCHLKDDYIKGQIKTFLKELNLEADWVDEAQIRVRSNINRPEIHR